MAADTRFALSDNRAYQTVLIAILGLGMVAAGMYLLVGGRYNWLTALLVFGSLAMASVIDKKIAIALTFSYLLFLGDLRRIGTLIYGTPKPDLLIMEGAAVALLIALPLLVRVRLSSALSKTLFALTVIMALEGINPRQGGISAGIAGTLFFTVPTLWFWIGRRYGSPALVQRIIFRIVVPIACLAACLGLFQTFVGFLPWEQAWINAERAAGLLTALFIEGHARAFGFSVSGTEYSTLLSIGCASSLAALLGGKRVYGLLLPLLLPLLVLSSVRSALVKLLVSIAMIWALRTARGRSWIPRFVLCLLFALAAAVYLAANASSSEKQARSSAAQGAISHEADLFNHPLSRKHSTLGVHSGYLLGGIAHGFTSPIGYGIGAGAVEGGDSGGEHIDVTESDFGDMFVTCGFPGGFLYLFFMFLVFRALIKFVRADPNATNLAVVGILFASVGVWMGSNAGYCIPPILFFLMGSLEFSSSRLDKTDRDIVWDQPRSLLLTAGGNV